jgi:catechol 2,3-dioxygenase-like lactoylglutathione lyase family enzyme
MRARLHHVILDCPDPRALARFYSALLNHPITRAGDDFAVVAANDTTSGLAFQLAPDHRAPTWPDTAVPQQMHLDIMVESVAHAMPYVLGLGATKLDGEACSPIRPGIHSASSSVPAGLSPSRTDRHPHRLIAHSSRL